jgi:hypothetical protein
MKYLLALSIVVVFFSSCSNDNEKKLSDTASPVFRSYLSKFKVIEMPFYFNGWDGNSLDTKKLFLLDSSSNDKLFFLDRNNTFTWGYGMLPDTSKYYSLIYFGMSEEKFPILATYSKQGKLIDHSSLVVHGCGSDCGLSYCSFSARISNNLSIVLSDTLKYEGTCDNLGMKPNSDTTFINVINGTIDDNGFIKLGKETNQKIKGH